MVYSAKLKKGFEYPPEGFLSWKPWKAFPKGDVNKAAEAFVKFSSLDDDVKEDLEISDLTYYCTDRVN